jgi:hypothetical protein
MNITKMERGHPVRNPSAQSPREARAIGKPGESYICSTRPARLFVLPFIPGTRHLEMLLPYWPKRFRYSLDVMKDFTISALM